MKFKSLLLFLCFFLTTALAAWAADGSSLKPPPGSNVALIVFEDLECPSCATAAPVLEEAAKQYNVPLVIHDFPLRQHPWAMDGALLARYFASKSKTLGDEFRLFIYQNQSQITKGNLHSYAERFASEHKVDLPFVVDPQGQLAAGIKADQDLGQKVDLTETPTIFVVSNKEWKQVTDTSTLYTVIDQVKANAGPPPSAAPAKTASKRAPRKPGK